MSEAASVYRSKTTGTITDGGFLYKQLLCTTFIRTGVLFGWLAVVMWHDEPATLVAVFKNSLMYTTAFEISKMIPTSDGETSIVFISCIMIVVLLLHRVSTYIRESFANADEQVKRMVDPLKSLFVFLVDCITNLLVQIVSTMVGTLVTTAVQQTSQTTYSVIGSVLSLCLVWLLSNMINSV